MKKIFLLLACFLCYLSVQAQFSAQLTGYPLVTTGWLYSTEASAIDSELQITAPVDGQASYVFYNTAVNMAAYCQFTVDFDFQIKQYAGTTVADGLAFWFLTNPPLSGTTGSAIGLPNFPNGLVLVMDTYDNNGDGNNPLETLLGYTGTTTTYVEASTAGLLAPVVPNQYFIDNGAWHHCKVTYNMGNINVYYNYSTTPSLTGYFPLSITGYFGFSASTGALVSTQSVKQVFITTNACLTPENNGPLCQGDSLKLYAVGDSTGATYYWYGPGGFTSTLQDPVLPGVVYADSGLYHVVKTVSGVHDTAATDVVIKHTPALTATSNSPICVGSTLNFTAAPDSTGETFSWTGPNAFTSALENPSITGAPLTDTGVYTVVATWNGCKDTATTHVIIIHVAKPTAANNTPICVGSNVLLTSTDSIAGAAFSWAGPAGFTAAVQNPTITSAGTAASGIYTVTASVGTCTDTAQTLVTVSPAPPIPVIPVTPPICSGLTLNLIVTPGTDTPGATYSWVGPNGFTSTMEDPSITAITVAASGHYTVVETYNGCSAPYAVVNVFVDSTPATPAAFSNSPICSDSTLLLFSTCATAGVTYSWSGPASFASTMQNPFIFNAQSFMSGNYSVTATLYGVCHSTSSTTVLINQSPSLPLTAGSDTVICSGTLLHLASYSTPTTGTYYWVGPNGFTSSIQYPNILPSTTANSGTYFVHEVVNGCFSDTAAITVLVNETPGIPLAWSNSPVCEGDTLRLFASDTTPLVSYSWIGALGFTSVSQDTIIANVVPATAGVYTVTATLGTCSASGLTGVSITNSPAIIAGSNSPVCTGDTLKLFGTSAIGNTFYWSGPYTFMNTSPNPVRYPAVMEYAGVYTVTATGPGGCYSTAFDTVVIHQTPAPTWVPWLTYCQFNDAPQLNAVDAPNVLWYPTRTGGVGNSIAPIPTTSIPGIYYYYLTETDNGCTSARDSVQVVVHPKPIITLSPAYSEICPHDSIAYSATDIDPLATWHWYPFYYLSDTNSSSTVAKPIDNIDYSLVATSIYGCTDTAHASVVVFPAGVIFATASDSVVLYPGETYQVQTQTNCTSLLWFPSEGLDNPNLSNPTITGTVSTRYTVTGVTDHGCVAYDSIFFHVNNETLYGIPNAFTPGTGVNSIFKLLTRGIATLNYFRVYDRWGVLVFETHNIDEGWDGSYKGQPQPFGVYVYDVQAVSSVTGKVISMTGNITLIR